MRPFGPRARALVAYAAAAALSLGAAVFLLRLWRADLRVPIDYRGDAIFNAYLVKSVVDHGWYLVNPNLGAPGVLHLHDFPPLDNLHLVIVRLMSALSRDWALLFNVYFLAGFPLITLTSLLALRQLGVATVPAVVASVLYAFLPSRLIKGEGHLFLDSFYQVPLAVMVMLWVCGPDPPLTRDRGRGRLPGLELRSGRAGAAVFICLASASLSVYYAFFTALLLVAGGAWASLERRSARHALAGVALAATIGVGLAANMIPTFVYHARHGPNPEVGVRWTGEAEMYGMKIAQLLLPVDGHRVHALAALKDRYNETAPLVTENTHASLGAVGALGFLMLLGLLFAGPRPGRPREDVLRPLSVLNAMALLLATLGGFGSLFALLVSPQIRAYTRMNVVIGFFALAAVALLLERVQRRFPRAGWVLLAAVLGVGLLDQTTHAMIRPFAATRTQYRSDDAFVRRVEGAVPPGAFVLELPYMIFPESPPQVGMAAYDHLVPYLHSSSLRWTFPTMRGRPGNDRLRELSNSDPATLPAALRAAGGAGILIDRAGYDDHGRALEAALRSLLPGEPIASSDGRRVFFSLGASPPSR